MSEFTHPASSDNSPTDDELYGEGNAHSSGLPANEVPAFVESMNEWIDERRAREAYDEADAAWVETMERRDANRARFLIVGSLTKRDFDGARTYCLFDMQTDHSLDAYYRVGGEWTAVELWRDGFDFDGYAALRDTKSPNAIIRWGAGLSGSVAEEPIAPPVSVRRVQVAWHQAEAMTIIIHGLTPEFLVDPQTNHPEHASRSKRIAQGNVDSVDAVIQLFPPKTGGAA